MSRRLSSAIAILCLLFSGSIYFLFRSTDMYMFLPIKACGEMDKLNDIRSLFADCHLPDWFLYSLPDGLWLYAYMLFIRALWNTGNSNLKTLFLLLLPILAFTFEALQFLSLYQGTGDVGDVIFYILFIALYLIF